MQRFNAKTALFFPVMVLSATLVTSAHANYFHDPETGSRLYIGSAPSPTPADLRGVYPMTSRSMNEQGLVELKLLLSEKGTVSGAVVEKSSGSPRLDDAAIRYAKTYWSYEPPSGQEMPTEMSFNVNFVLR